MVSAAKSDAQRSAAHAPPTFGVRASSPFLTRSLLDEPFLLESASHGIPQATGTPSPGRVAGGPPPPRRRRSGPDVRYRRLPADKRSNEPQLYSRGHRLRRRNPDGRTY